MLISIADLDAITRAVVRQLQEFPGMEDAIVERYEPDNGDANRCPWVGVYVTAVRLIPRTVGLGAGYREQAIDFALLLQEASFSSGEVCGSKLAALIQRVGSALCSDESLRGTVDTLQEMQVTFSEYSTDEGVYKHTALLSFTGLLKVTALL